MYLGGLLLLALLGCDARYESLFRTATTSRDAGTPDDGGPVQPDLGAIDQGAVEQGQPTVLATGAWQGRTGYAASGSVNLVALGDGTFEVSFSEDFDVGGVPSPVVLLTTRPAVTGGVDEAAGDVSLGRLSARTGAQRYAVPPSATGAAYVFVYCLPFTVEVARAQLVPAP